jgi:saccharopine dehydrogenase-like NADP-dependent oxidoreductase
MKNGKRVRMQWDLHDRYDRTTRCTSMSRTTAFPCTIMARMLATGELSKPGVIVPEMLGGNAKLVERVLAQHAERGVEYRSSEVAL